MFRVLLEDHSDIGLATVYRVLTQFEQAGILTRSHFESGKAVYELNEGTHHDHLVCLDCGRVEEFYDPEIEKRQNAVAIASQTTYGASADAPGGTSDRHSQRLHGAIVLCPRPDRKHVDALRARRRRENSPVPYARCRKPGYTVWLPA